jgi:membrane-associated phospholipid phosphatase
MLDVPDAAKDAHPVEQADAAVAEAAGRYRHSPVVKALGAFGDLADQPPLIAGTILALGVGWWRGDARLMRAGARMLAAELVATGLKAAVKASVSRTRPRLLVEEGRYETMTGGPNEGPWNSFPSGHTAGAVAVSRALVREYPDAAPYAYGAAGVAAAIQIPKCAHYPTDVGAGALLGWIAEALVDQIARRIAQRRLGDGWEASRAASSGGVSASPSMVKPSRA